MTNHRQGWGDLQGIIQSNRELQRELEAEGIPGTGGMMTCPNCGSPLLRRDRDGLWDCPMGCYTSTNGPRGVP